MFLLRQFNLDFESITVSQQNYFIFIIILSNITEVRIFLS
jgi:hypothetical protein